MAIIIQKIHTQPQMIGKQLNNKLQNTILIYIYKLYINYKYINIYKLSYVVT